MANASDFTFDFDFSPHKDYQPYTGEGASDSFPLEGFYALQLGSFKPYESKDSKRPMLKVGSVAQDEDAKGLRMIDDVTCGGLDRNGKDMGRQFLDLLHSSGTPVEAIQQNAAKGQKADIKAICKSLENRIAYAEIGTELDNKNQERSVVKNWITKDRYDQAKAVGAHRRPRRVVSAATQAGQAYNVGGAANGTAAAGGTAAATANSMPML